MVMMKFFTILLLLHNVMSDLDTTWWKNTVIYEAYLWSMKDSDGNGVGDFQGLKSKLSHFNDLKIETIYLPPFFESPMKDMGYDVSNYTAIAKQFGTMGDFEELIDEMNKLGLKLMIDLVINHSSDKHPWFAKSIDRVYPFTDFYVWQNPKGFDNAGNPIPPNNWLSRFQGSAWEWNDKRKQYYFHQFGVYQPDLNLRNKALRAEIKKIILFWLKKGVAGFRLDATNFYIEDEKLRDEPLLPTGSNPNSWIDLSHIYTTDLWESYEFIHDVVRQTVDEYSLEEGNFERILVAEAYTSLYHTMAYYGKKNYPIMHFPFNFEFVSATKMGNARTIQSYLHRWLDNMPKGATANWVSENHDNSRVGSHFGEEFVDIILTVTMMAPGVAVLYYGQEIGMSDGRVRSDQRHDLGGGTDFNRDNSRLPMQWDDSINGGFSNSLKTWLPVNPNYWEVNVEAQKNSKISRYNLVKNLIKIRKTTTMKRGYFKSYKLSKWVLAFTRFYESYDTYLTIINLGSETELIDVHIQIPNLTPKLEVVASSINSGYIIGTMLDYKPKFPGIFAMRPLSTIVLKTIHESKHHV